MAGELAHVSVGTELTQAEFEGTTLHQFNSQAVGDIAYASSTTQISRLAKGANGDSLTLASGVPAWNTAVQSDVTSSRALNTVYQNTSGRPLLITVTLSFSATLYLRVKTDVNVTPTAIVGYLSGDPSAGWFYLPITFVVLPSNYYWLDNWTGTAPDILTWFEWEI